MVREILCFTIAQSARASHSHYPFEMLLVPHANVLNVLGN